MQTKQQGLMEYRLNLLNFLPMLLTNPQMDFLWEVYETFINDSMLPIIQTFLSNFVSAHRKYYSANHVLISLIESWCDSISNREIVGPVFMDLSKAVDCIPHDLFIAKMEAYGFSEDLLFCIHTSETSKTIRKH